MKVIQKILNKKEYYMSLESESLIMLSVFIIFITALIIINFNNNVLFHTGIEVFNVIISFGIFTISLNTYKISKNNCLIFLGIGFFFVGIADLLHSFAYPGVSILFEHGSQNISTQLWISARYLEAFTCLVSSILVINPKKIIKPYSIFLIYLFITIFLILSIFHFNLFPTCFTDTNGLTQFKIVSECIISLMLSIVSVIYFKLKANMDDQLFFYMECFLIISTISEIFLIQFDNPYNLGNVLAHLLKVTASYFIYKALITTSLRIPHKVLYKRLSETEDELKRTKFSLKENEKKLSETIKFNRMMTDFFSNISHELKTPLNVILGAIQIFELPANTDTQGNNNKYLKAMKQNCYRLLRLVNNLTDLSKFDSGYLRPNLRNYNIVNVVEDITLSIADYAEDRGIELIFDTDTEEKIMAVDADKIERIILNLLSNAIKFTNNGDQILVNIIDNNDKVCISVKDTGIGIPEDKLTVIFERFRQLDISLARNHCGCGIGLSLVKSLVDIHGGTISVESKLGQGSEFIIELPVKLVEEKNSLEYMLYQSKVERINIEFSDIYAS